MLVQRPSWRFVAATLVGISLFVLIITATYEYHDDLPPAIQYLRWSKSGQESTIKVGPPLPPPGPPPPHGRPPAHGHGHGHGHPPPPPPPDTESDPEAISPAADRCRNPFLFPGYIQDTPKAWKPTSECMGHDAQLSQLPSLLPHLGNKTYYFYGDSVIRMAMTDLCHFIGAPQKSLDPNPPGYLVTGDQQRVHWCTHPKYNFTAVNIYHFGMHEFRNGSEVDDMFTRGHLSFDYKKDQDKTIWNFEKRMGMAQETVLAKFGPPDALMMGTGIWDLAYLQQDQVYGEVRGAVPQSEAPTEEWLAMYGERVRGYLRHALKLNPGVKKVFYLTLHDPKTFEFQLTWGLHGFTEEFTSKAKFSPLLEVRVRALRNEQIRVLLQEKEREERVMVLPYDQWIREAPPDKRMRDNLHPNSWANELFAMATVLLAEEL